MKPMTMTIAVLVLAATPVRGEFAFDQAEVAPGVIVFTSREPGVGNAVAVITDRDVLVVDSSISPAESRTMLDAIRLRTDKPVRYIVNTHWHDDHVWGNQTFVAASPGVEVLSHRKTRDAVLNRAVPALEGQIARLAKKIEERQTMLQRGVDGSGAPLTEDQRTKMGKRLAAMRAFHQDAQTIHPTPPTFLFERELTLHRGDQTIRIIALGRGHTEGDVVVHLPERGVLIAGDIVTLPFPAAAEAYVSDWIATLEQLDALAFDQLVPGHGPVLEDRAYVRAFRDLLASVLAQVERAIADGMNLEDTLDSVNVDRMRDTFVTADTPEDRAFDRFFLRPAVESAYRELSAADD